MIFEDPTCDVCDTPLTGRQKRYCSDRCRQAHRRATSLTAAEKRAKSMGKDCERCGDVFDPRNGRQRHCSANCAAQARDAGYEAREDAVCQLDECGDNAGWSGTGRARRYCTDAHRKKAYRQRNRTA